ncbi:putative bidirectional sugar transporter SWEET14-like [Sesbania bispinosa]|nr:putative bidirectional sugar transporter SWEET14-like [Sesbania bispinosa]
MVLFMIYTNTKTVEPAKLQELNGHIIDVVKLSTMAPSDPNSGALNVTVIEEDPNGKQELKGVARGTWIN